ncbi:MAG: hypothetical protein D6B26_00810, partial [Spirochaetaceae bacterium]
VNTYDGTVYFRQEGFDRLADIFILAGYFCSLCTLAICSAEGDTAIPRNTERELKNLATLIRTWQGMADQSEYRVSQMIMKPAK